MLLHTVSKSPHSSDALASCLRTIQPGARLLLLEDAVYAALPGDALTTLPEGVDCYALAADVEARGLAGQLSDLVQLADDDDFVSLSVECHAVQSWY